MAEVTVEELQSLLGGRAGLLPTLLGPAGEEEVMECPHTHTLRHTHTHLDTHTHTHPWEQSAVADSG